MRVLDTTVPIDFLRGRPAVQRVAALRISGEVPATTAINVEEIARGLRRRDEADAAHRLFDGLEPLPIGRRPHGGRDAGGSEILRREHVVVAAAG